MNNIDLRLEEKRVRVQQLTLELLSYPAKDSHKIADAISHIQDIRKTILPTINGLTNSTETQPVPVYERYRRELESVGHEFTSCMEHLQRCHLKIINIAMHAPVGISHNIETLVRPLHSEVLDIKPLEDLLTLPEGKTLSTRVTKLASAQKEFA